MAFRAATEEGAIVTKRTRIEILADARRGNLEELRRLLFTMIRRNNPDRDEVLNNSLMAVYEKLKDGVPHSAIAQQLGGIVQKQSLRIWEREAFAQRVLLSENELHLLEKADELSDPAREVERLEDLNERISVLRKIKTERPGDFEVLVAEVREGDASDRLGASSTHERKSAASYSARYRAHKNAKKLLENTRRKDTSS